VTDGIGPAGVTPLGHEVFQIDTRMAGYGGITAGYLIRDDQPCLVETGGARHLADPGKLMAGARMVYGRALERLFGVRPRWLRCARRRRPESTPLSASDPLKRAPAHSNSMDAASTSIGSGAPVPE